MKGASAAATEERFPGTRRAALYGGRSPHHAAGRFVSGVVDQLGPLFFFLFSKGFLRDCVRDF